MRRLKPLLGSALVLITLPLTASAAVPTSLEKAVEHLSRELAAELQGKHVKKLAVLDFSDASGFPSTLNHVVAEELANQLHAMAPGEFTMVERRRLEQVRSEQMRNSSKFFDEQSLANVGKVLGLDAIVSGTIADFGTSVKIYAQAIAVETAEVFASSSARVAKDSSIESLLYQGAAPSLPPGMVNSFTGRASSRGRLVQSPDVFFQNKFIRLTADSVSVTRDGKRAVVVLKLENLTPSDLHLAFEKDSYCDVQLVDNRGFYSRHGSNRVTGLTCIAAEEASEKPAGLFTMVSAKSRTTMTLRFLFMKPVTGDRLAFSADFLHRQANRTSRFSAGLANLRFTRDADPM